MKQDRQVRPTSRGARGNDYILSRDLNPKLVSIASCKLLGRETRKHPPGQVRKLAASLDRFGFVLPILTDPHQRVVAGWGLVLAAKRLGLAEVPAVTITDLPEAELRVLRLALNRITEDTTWDCEELALEFSEILKLDPHIELQPSGFDIAEIDIILDLGGHDELDVGGPDKEDVLLPVEAAPPAVTQLDDCWALGDHRLVCGDALQGESFSRVLGSEKADMVFADPPSTLAMSASQWAPSSAELAVPSSHQLSGAQLESWLKTSLGHAARCSRDGAIHFVCSDWRKLSEVLAAGKEIYASFENLCVWTRSDQSTAASILYRPQHQLILVFRVGQSAPINNVGCRRRIDVWDYASPKGLNNTSKPVAMIADAIRDCSNRGDVILDPFGSCGTTLIAAEQTGRRARVIERHPILVDLSIERWQRLTGSTARHAESGRPFIRNRNAEATAEERPHSHDR
jgi:DNA modification methylase